MKKSDISFKIKASELIKALQKSSGTSEETIRLHLSEVEDLRIHGESSTKKSQDDYDHFEKLIKDYGINLKDMREVIMLANSWWIIGPLCTDQEMIENYLTSKDDFRDNVYSWELISLVLNALSSCKDPVSDFYSRIIMKTNPEEYEIFTNYLKAAYGTKE